MQYNQASSHHHVGLLRTRNKPTAVNEEKHYQSASQTLRNAHGFTAKLLVWIFFDGIFISCWVLRRTRWTPLRLYVSLRTWSNRSWSDAVPKGKAFTSPRVSPQQMSEGQMETVPLLLLPFPSFTAPSPAHPRRAKIRGTYFSAQRLSRNRSHSQTDFSGPGKHQEQALFGSLNFHQTALQIISFVIWTCYAAAPENSE